MDVDEESQMMVKCDNAVVVEGVHKCYTESAPVLNGLDMTVPNAGIYGLLGASGCGKTTLLSCILGLQQQDSGRITIFGKPAGSKELAIPGRTVGYMSQDIALYPFFSIDETLSFFGNVYGMGRKAIRQRTKFLCRLFVLPGGTRTVGSLSGGQQRRVSLAVALLHAPRLLILDEPTVGVDSMLRNSIWNYLNVLTEEGKTIIITTHYIEEAVSANRIGLMSNGHILAEDTPNALMEHHKVTKLEDVFMKVSKQQHAKEWASAGEILKSHQTNIKKEKGKSDIYDKNPEAVKRFSSLRGVIWKNVAHIVRSPMEILFYFMVPIGCVVLVNLCMGNPPRDLPVALVNFERPDSPVCEPHPYCAPLDLSCNFIDTLDKKMVQLIPFGSVEEAVDSVHRGETWGIITLAGNFSTHLQMRFSKGIKADPDEILGSQIHLTFDMTNQQIVLFVYRMIMESLNTFGRNFMTACKVLPDAVSFPLVIDEPIYGDMNYSFREYAVPAILLFAACTLIQHYSAIPFIKEKNEGVLDRLWICGLRDRTMFSACIFIQFVLMTLVFGATLFVAVVGFGLPVHGSFVSLFFLFFLMGSGAIAIGNLLSIALKSETLLIEIILSFFIMSVIVCGPIWPVESMDKYMYTLTMLLPYTQPLSSCRHILMQGWGITHPRVWPGFAVAVIWDVILFALLYLFIVWNRRNTHRNSFCCSKFAALFANRCRS